jgi:hypothetical protein
MKWLWLRRKPRVSARKIKDVFRHYRVAQRLLLRMEEAAARGDLERVKVLSLRIRKVRDIQIAELGH